MSEEKRDYTADLAACEKATKGPWDIRGHWGSVHGKVIYSGVGEENRTIANFPYGNVVGLPEGWKEKDRVYQQLLANVGFIALARTALPWYIRKVMELEESQSISRMAVNKNLDDLRTQLAELDAENARLREKYDQAIMERYEETKKAARFQVEKKDLEAEKAFMSAHENNIRQKYGLSPDVGFGDLARYRDDLRTRLAAAEGREGALREALDTAKEWCPECHGFGYIDEKPCDTCEKVRDAYLSQTPAPVNLEAMRRVVTAARKYVDAEDRQARENTVHTPEYVIDAWNGLVVALADYEGGGAGE